MKSYRVVWEIDIEANSPQEAARRAFEVQHDTGTLADHFTVYDEDGNSTEVDAAQGVGGIETP